jgi:hypothetical protein
MNSPVRHQDSALKSTPLPHVLAVPAPEAVTLDLTAVLIAVREDEPVVAVVPAAAGGGLALPSGPFTPSEHASLEQGLRDCVARQTGILLTDAPPLSTLGVSVRGERGGDKGAAQRAPALPGPLPAVSLCFLALIGPPQQADRPGTNWLSWYSFFPWEDWRHGKPPALAIDIEPRLETWTRGGLGYPVPSTVERARRVHIAFGDGAGWDEEKVVERYDILCEAGLAGQLAGGREGGDFSPQLGHPALGDHARMLASAIAELRRAVKCRPVVFDLMPEVFTLYELQKTVEAILGPHLHKQNFRRLVEGGGLVEPTGDHRFRTGGRPARLYRFRRDVLLERPAPGVRVKAGRT